jgi:hypothetical protein
MMTVEIERCGICDARTATMFMVVRGELVIPLLPQCGVRLAFYRTPQFFLEFHEFNGVGPTIDNFRGQKLPLSIVGPCQCHGWQQGRRIWGCLLRVAALC